MIRPEHPFDIRPDLHKAASVIRPNQLVREVFMFYSKFAEISHLTCMWDNKSDFL